MIAGFPHLFPVLPCSSLQSRKGSVEFEDKTIDIITEEWFHTLDPNNNKLFF